MAFFFVWVSIMGLYMKGPWAISAARQCLDFLWANSPNIGVAHEAPMCPPKETCTRVASGMWKLLRMPLEAVGSTFLSGSSDVNLDKTMALLRHDLGPCPLFAREHGLAAHNFSTQTDIKSPTDQPAAPRAFDVAGHIGKIAEALRRTCCR
eukprot:5179320-Pyramimonas_sp.AAC.1